MLKRMLPNEMFLTIFAHLDETDLISCMSVNKNWHSITNNLNLLYISEVFSKTLSFELLLTNCCQNNYILSFDKTINKLNNIFPQINYVNLWNKCIKIACRKGHFSLFKRLHGFAIYDSNELITIAREYEQHKIIDFIVSEVDQNSRYL
jgi:hypothetical protein